MIACLCAGVSVTAVERAVREGAETVAEIGRSCGAGTGCGACHPLLREIVAAARAHCKLRAAPAPSQTPAVITEPRRTAA